MDVLNRKKSLFHIIVLTTVVCISYYFIQLNLLQKVALFAVGPHTSVNFETQPQNFEKDWKFQFKNAQDFMLATKLYVYAQKYLNIKPSALMYVQVFVQLSLICFGAAYLSYILFGDLTLASISAIFVTITDIMSLNLSRHGPSIDIPAYSGIPNGLMLVAISFFLQNRFGLYFILSLVTAYFYLNLGLILSIFTLSYVCVKPGLLKKVNFLPYFLLYILFLIPYIYIILHSSDVLQSNIPVDKWVQLARIFSVHWFPSTLSSFFPYYFVPIITLCALFLLSLEQIRKTEEIHIKIFIGFISIVIISVIGIVCGEFYPIPIILKISLQRSMMLISVIGSLYIINYLYHKILFDNPLVSILALIIILLPFFSMFGWSVFAVLLIIFIELKRKLFKP